jgi:hypothetical protein
MPEKLGNFVNINQRFMDLEIRTYTLKNPCFTPPVDSAILGTTPPVDEKWTGVHH